MVKSSYRECECHTRILIVRGVPALNYGPDPAGTVAVTITDPRRGRWLKQGEDATSLEHRHSVHECDKTRASAHRQRKHEARSKAGQPARRPAPTQPTLDIRTTP